MHGSQAGGRRALRCRAIRPLVVRRAALARLSCPQDCSGPVDHSAGDAFGIPRRVSSESNRHSLHVELGPQRLQRGVAERRE